MHLLILKSLTFSSSPCEISSVNLRFFFLVFTSWDGDVTDKMEITLKVVIYNFILAFQNISDLKNMTFTYCLQFWVDLFLSLLGRISSWTGGGVGIGWHLCLDDGLLGVSFGGALCCAISVGTALWISLFFCVGFIN